MLFVGSPGMKPSAQALAWITDVTALRHQGVVLTATRELDLEATQAQRKMMKAQ